MTAMRAGRAPAVALRTLAPGILLLAPGVLVLALGVLVLALGVLVLAPGTALAHDEREVEFPDGTGSVPTRHEAAPHLLVCKDDRADFTDRVAGFPADLRARNLALFDECQQSGFRHLQEAVDAASPGTRILVLPGEYREEPSLAPAPAHCADLDAPTGGGQEIYLVLSFEQQRSCPHEQNLVAVLGKEDLQIEGTGADPTDVVIDAQYRKLNAIRADRADGFQLRNLTAQRTTFNAVYVLETDGFTIDSVVARWNVEYGFLMFANDHGLLSHCEGYGNGDAAIYPGSASNLNSDAGHEVERYAVEITGCYAHDNLLGYSGTAGNSVWAHDNVFTGNGAGVAMDSAFPGHPGLPQNHARFERNVIGDNNQDYYRYVRDGTCARPVPQRGYEDGVVCPVVGLPTGTGVINPGGNYNTFRENWVYGHAYAGFVTSWVPGFIRGANGLAEQFDTSHHNRYLGNHFGETPEGESRPNRIDFWWDGQGRGSCWQDPGGLRSEPQALPACGADGLPAGAPVARLLPEPAKLLTLLVCAEYSMADAAIPATCEWYGAAGLGRVEVRAALAEAVLLALALVGLWLRRLRRAAPAGGVPAGSGVPADGGVAAPGVLVAGGVAVAVAGLVVGVLGAGHTASVLPAVGLALFGLGTVPVGLALRRAGRAGLGWLTVALGVVALLGAVDRGLTMIPYLPVPPSVLRLLIELVWLPWVAVVLLRRDRRPAPEPEPEPQPAPAG